MSQIRIALDLRDYDDKLGKLRRALRVLGHRIIIDSSAVVFWILQANTPVRTGRLKGSITRTVHHLTAIIRTNTGYGRFVDEGTRPHEIRARRAKALRFEIEGRVIFRKKVQHPGFPPRNFKAKTLQQARPKIIDAIKRAYADEVKK